MPDLLVKQELERLYHFYNSRRWVHPDPLEFLYAYPNLEDREAAGLIASSLAYGRVTQILKSVSTVLERLGPSPAAFLTSASDAFLSDIFADFRHRFTSGQEIALLLVGIKRVLKRDGSLGRCFRNACRADDGTILPGLILFVDELSAPFASRTNSLLPRPQKGSACKRLNLFLRWMVRQDRVDPGGWDWVNPCKLIVPLDTHMHRIAMGLGFTKSRYATIKTALEVTRAFIQIHPHDPVRYDFSLTRTAIRNNGQKIP
ncbi:MAG: TIGR02757 family protein [Desulfococcus sp. 4484_242]|nr:MAG: TIGR02757 family protein [Desulfococcus sp. 4484_242]